MLFMLINPHSNYKYLVMKVQLLRMWSRLELHLNNFNYCERVLTFIYLQLFFHFRKHELLCGLCILNEKSRLHIKIRSFSTKKSAQETFLGL